MGEYQPGIGSSDSRRRPPAPAGRHPAVARVVQLRPETAVAEAAGI